MTELNRALNEIQAIRRQVARTTEFRGYGPLTLCCTAAVAGIGGLVQFYALPKPWLQPAFYAALWLSVGFLSAGLILAQMLRRADRMHGGLADTMIRTAVGQFLPAAAAGLILPFVLLHGSRDVFWMLPGLWQVIFSLGVFASCRSMPWQMLLAGGWFLLTGVVCLWLGDTRALSPVTMAGSYAVGMTMVGGIHGLTAKKAGIDEEEEK